MNEKYIDFNSLYDYITEKAIEDSFCMVDYHGKTIEALYDPLAEQLFYCEDSDSSDNPEVMIRDVLVGAVPHDVDIRAFAYAHEG